jgi:hypothetical protein
VDSNDNDQATSEDVAAWFVEAAPKRLPREVRIPNASDPEVVDLSRFVNIAKHADESPHRIEALLRAAYEKETNPEKKRAWKLYLDSRAAMPQQIAERKRAQQLAAALAAALPGQLDDPMGWLDDEDRAELAAAVDTIVRVLGKPDRAKSASARWHIAAYDFAELARAAWEAADWVGISDTTDGPVLRVVLLALKAAGTDISMPTLITAMKARPAGIPPMRTRVPRG